MIWIDTACTLSLGSQRMYTTLHILFTWPGRRNKRGISTQATSTSTSKVHCLRKIKSVHTKVCMACLRLLTASTVGSTLPVVRWSEFTYANLQAPWPHFRTTKTLFTGLYTRCSFRVLYRYATPTPPFPHHPSSTPNYNHPAIRCAIV